MIPPDHFDTDRLYLRIPRRVFATCDVDNSASAKVMEKAGMKYEGLFDVRGDENREIVGA